MNWFSQSKDREHRQRLPPSQRIDLIYGYTIHKEHITDISRRLDIEKSTVSKIVKAFREEGRLFKLLPRHSKIFILKARMQSKQSQRLYKKHRVLV